MTPTRKIVLAVVLWLVFAAVVWNVVFDRLIVLAGRQYSYDATVLYNTTGRYLLINDVMRPAVSHAVVVASTVAGVVATVGLVLVRLAARQHRSAARR